jgi:hypothetical protein
MVIARNLEDVINLYYRYSWVLLDVESFVMF